MPENDSFEKLYSLFIWLHISSRSKYLPNNYSSVTHVLYGEQSVADTLSQFLSRQNGVDLCSDANNTAQVLEIYRKMSFDPKTKTGIKIRFLTDFNKDK